MKFDIVVLDGLNIFLRQWAANPHMDSNGEPVGGLVGTLRVVKNMLRDTQCLKFIVAWDGEGGSGKRRGIYADYKAGRKPRANRQYDHDSLDESQKNLRSQRQRLATYLTTLGVTQVEVDGVEADDVIAYLCLANSEQSKVIVSSDRDFLQLVNEKTLIYSPVKKLFFGSPEVVKETGCLPENYILMKSVCGDGSDNIKGIKNLGPKTMAKFFPELSVRNLTLSELFELAEKATPKGMREKELLKELLAARELVMTNHKLMSLSGPMISAHAGLSIRNQLDAKSPALNITSCRMALARDGIQIVDQDFFSSFTRYSIRSAQTGREINKTNE